MRKLSIKAQNVEMDVNSWGNIYVNNKSLNDLLADNMQSGRFNAKVTIIIEELENGGLQIESNKPQPESNEEQENE